MSGLHRYSEELRECNGINTCPDDFDRFWDEALVELRNVDPQIELIKAEFQVPYADCFHLYFTGVREARIHVKYLRPKNLNKKHPAILQFHGYSGDSGDWYEKLPYAALGFSVFTMDCRGQGGLSEDTGGVKGNTFHGHIIRGLDDKSENLLFRQIFLDTVQLASIAMNMTEVDENRVCAMGASLGGALALVCAALEPRIKLVASVYPYLCDYKGILETSSSQDAYKEIRDYFRMFDPQHKREKEIFTKLGYIDIQNLVMRVRGEVFFFTGLMDTVCPPSTQFMLYNKIQRKKEIITFPDYGHEKIPGVNDEIIRFMMGVLNDKDINTLL